MPIILFTGAGQSKRLIEVEYKNNKFVKNNFIDKLRKITSVTIPDIKYKHVYYYQKNDQYKQVKYFDPITKLTLNDISIEKTIKNLKFNKNKKYIVMGYSDGIYFAMEFAKQYSKQTKEIISLDGSWITVDLCKQRLANWKKNGKKVKSITKQKELDTIVKRLKEEMLNSDRKKIMNHKRLEHTNKCIRSKYQDLIKKHKFTLFRDYVANPKNNIDLQYNDYVLREHEILSKYKKYKVYWMLNASHTIWSNEIYKNIILDYVKSNVL